MIYNADDEPCTLYVLHHGTGTFFPLNECTIYYVQDGKDAETEILDLENRNEASTDDIAREIQNSR